MNDVLRAVIERFRAAQDRGVAALTGQLGIPLPASNIAWLDVCMEHGLGKIRSLKGIPLYAHGYGVELIFDDMTIDWDWGDAGEPDGFDDWRLWNFISVNKLEVPCKGLLEMRAWLEQAHAAELTRDSYLYYSPAHRAAGYDSDFGPDLVVHSPGGV